MVAGMSRSIFALRTVMFVTCEACIMLAVRVSDKTAINAFFVIFIKYPLLRLVNLPFIETFHIQFLFRFGIFLIKKSRTRFLEHFAM